MKMNQLKVGGLATLLLAGLIGVAVPGCSSSTVLPTQQHAPSDPATVAMYQKEPAKYEVLGTIMVPVTPELRWDDRGDSVAGIDAMKAKAASMGANGVLLIAPPGITNSAATVGYKGEHYQVPLKMEPRTAVGQAIFVHTNP
jgi:hypothetical protein